jgi:putative tricarboxylic transport membrane protein
MKRLDGLVRDGDVLSGAALAGLGTFILTTASQWTYTSADGPGPGFFPVWYGVLMIALSLVLIVSRILKPTFDDAEPIDWHGLSRALVTWLAFVAGIALLPYLGFLLSFGLLCLFLIVAVFRRPLRDGVLSGAIISLVFYGVFDFLLEVDLPTGFLGF